MSANILLKDNDLHLWVINLVADSAEQAKLRSWLSLDELIKADRFKFPIHRVRYIIGRGNLRRILSVYLKCLPHEVVFNYGKRGKPYLANQELKFNLSHSADIAVLILRKHYEIGIDIEKIESPFKQDVAQRFFSNDEYALLKDVDPVKRVNAFYTIWSKKEALIKALGEGLFAPLNDFLVTLTDQVETIKLRHEKQLQKYYIQTIAVDANYATALATTHSFQEIISYQSHKYFSDT